MRMQNYNKIHQSLFTLKSGNQVLRDGQIDTVMVNHNSLTPGLTIMPNYDYHDTMTIRDIPIMILSLSRV